MANVPLRRAILDAKLSNQNLADRCEVDVKTVERWLQDERESRTSGTSWWLPRH
ncbi:hypothetical protein ABT061_27910 [Streptosporangium sp. NPDC002544]|uniref:hypothetical protein n=1 Tax=Streptosporangium sp. NPDC002544 TaxID=3154538 RepID=UPI0033220FDE